MFIIILFKSSKDTINEVNKELTIQNTILSSRVDKYRFYPWCQVFEKIVDGICDSVGKINYSISESSDLVSELSDSLSRISGSSNIFTDSVIIISDSLNIFTDPVMKLNDTVIRFIDLVGTMKYSVIIFSDSVIG